MAEHQQRYKEFINFLNLICINVLYMIIEVMEIELPHLEPHGCIWKRKWLESSCK